MRREKIGTLPRALLLLEEMVERAASLVVETGEDRNLAKSLTFARRDGRKSGKPGS